MKLKHYGFSLLFAITAYLHASAQDFSNKGTEFWLAYCYHVGMNNAGANNQPVMTLYLTSDVNTSFKVEIYGGSTIQTGNITAGQVVTVIVPNTYFINNEGPFSNKAIHVTSAKPIVVYSYITQSAVSGATLCLPTNVLGKEYYSSNFTQNSNSPLSNSYITIIGVEDNTVVEITPSGNTKTGWLAGSTHTVNLNKGEIYQVLGFVNSYIAGTESGVDLSGSHIKSIASGTGGCKPIAVFSGSGKVFISTGSCPQSTSDNLYQQLYPIASWGLKYLTAPSYSRPVNIYRITRSDPAANVYLNGTLIPSASFVNNIYQFSNAIPNSIQSDKPICVAQYFTTQGCDGNASPYDPDMIILNPVEQNIDKVTLVSSNLVAAPPQHHIHVIMHNGGTGISSFKLDGASIPASQWVIHPGDPNYSYLYLANVSQGYHRIASDSGFNAIVYGYAPAESYGYSAGANVKDLYQFVSIKNQYSTVAFPAACRNSPFQFSMTFPYQPIQITWQFNGLFADTTVNSPAYDSTWVVNGKQLYRYSLPSFYTITTAGPFPQTYPITVLAQNPTSDGCTGLQEINYDLQVYDRPVANFNFATQGCVTDSVHFTDVSNTNGRNAYIWGWNFGDNTTSAVQNPAHLYTGPGSYTVEFSVITDIGCLSDTVSKVIALAVPPVAKFGVSAPNCVNNAITFTDSSSASVSTLAKWYWDFGDGTQLTANSSAAQTHTYATTGTFNVTLKVETATGCQSNVFTQAVIVHPNPLSSFTFGNACLPVGTMQFTNQSSVGDGSQLSYQWNFGDGGSSTQTNPSHNFASVGPFNVTLTALSVTGCAATVTTSVNKIYAQPQAAFSVTPEICLGGTLTFTDQSTAANSTVTQWQWNFGDGQSSAQQSPTHTYSAAGTYAISLTVTSAIGCLSGTITKTVIIDALPTANFTTSTPACETKSITFTDASVANSGNITQWIWDFGDGTTTTKTNNTAFAHTYATAGTYNVTLQVQTDKGCISTVVSKQIVIHPLPIPGFTTPGNCLTDPFSQFTDTSKIADGTQTQFTYLWNFGDANANAGNPNTSTVKNPQHKYTAVGNYNVTLTVTSVNGCSASISQSFTINGTTPQSAFTIQGGNQQCSNNIIALKNNSTVDFGNLIKLEIYWDYAGNPTNKTVIMNPPSGGTYSHTYPEFYSPATRTYTIQVVASSGINCLSTTTQTLTLMATPQVVFSALAPVCADVAPFQITQAGIANSVTGTGVYSGTGVSAIGLFSPQIAGAGTYTITYTFTAANGCINSKDQSITVFPIPVVDAGPDRFMLQGGSITLLGTASGNNLTYLWAPNIALNNNTTLQPVASPPDDLTYTLTVTSSDGCRATDQVFVKVLKAPTIPNAFSPNGDGINDRWEIQYLESYPGATVQIFNRYGQKVFESVGYTKPWDGSYKGNQVPAGTYYYIVDPKNGRKPITGFVDVIR